MTFDRLEDNIPRENIGKYLDVSGRLHSPTKEVLLYTLDLAAYFNTLGLTNDYALFGGYAVLSHLMKEQGEDVSVVWRGSGDIDIAGSISILNAVKSGYDIHSCLYSHNLQDKFTIKLVTKNSEDDECRIDFYNGDIGKRFGDIEINNHFGIPLRVVNPLSIIKRL